MGDGRHFIAWRDYSPLLTLYLFFLDLLSEAGKQRSSFVLKSVMAIGRRIIKLSSQKIKKPISDYRRINFSSGA